LGKKHLIFNLSIIKFESVFSTFWGDVCDTKIDHRTKTCKKRIPRESIKYGCTYVGLIGRTISKFVDVFV